VLQDDGNAVTKAVHSNAPMLGVSLPVKRANEAELKTTNIILMCLDDIMQRKMGWWPLKSSLKRSYLNKPPFQDGRKRSTKAHEDCWYVRLVNCIDGHQDGEKYLEIEFSSGRYRQIMYTQDVESPKGRICSFLPFEKYGIVQSGVKEEWHETTETLKCIFGYNVDTKGSKVQMVDIGLSSDPDEDTFVSVPSHLVLSEIGLHLTPARPANLEVFAQQIAGARI